MTVVDKQRQKDGVVDIFTLGVMATSGRAQDKLQGLEVTLCRHLHLCFDQVLDGCKHAKSLFYSVLPFTGGLARPCSLDIYFSLLEHFDELSISKAI